MTVTNETKSITVEVTPEREGEYYCTAGEEGSKSNRVEVIGEYTPQLTMIPQCVLKFMEFYMHTPHTRSHTDQ